MRISELEAIPVALPFRERYVTASGELDAREMVIVRIRSDEGGAGHGDAVPLSLRGGPALAEILAELAGPCREVLVGAELDSTLPPEEAGATIGPLLAACRAAGAGRGAISALDIALLDLVARSYGVPAWVVLGAGGCGPVRCNGTLDAGEPEAVAARGRELCEAGFQTLKVKVGRGADEERLEALRAACGTAVRLRVDANGAWSVRRAEQVLRSFGDFGLELAEQPCAGLEQLAELRGLTSVPIVADESIADDADAARALELGACDAATLKLAKVGGPHAALRLAERLPCYLSSALDSPLGIAAAAHTVQALPARGFARGLAHGLATSSMFADNIADAAPFAGPSIEPASGPGLGVEVDDDAIARLRT